MATEKLQHHAYRPSFIPVFLVTFVAGALTGALVVFLIRLAGGENPGVQSFTFLKVLSIVYLWCIAATAFVIWAFSVKVDVDGLRGRTFWGNVRRIAWADIGTVRATRMVAGLPFLRVLPSDGTTPLWLPLFIGRRDDFRQLVFDYAGPANALTRHLEQMK